MARTYAQVRVSVWQDDDFRDLPIEAQHLYFLLLTTPTMNLAGVSDWRPERIASLARGWTSAAVRKAARILEQRRYILTDDSTEEVLVRTLVKHDGILRNPKLATGMVSAWTGTFSKRLRAAIANEVQKLSDGVSETVERAITPLMDYPTDCLSDCLSDDQYAGASDQVADSPQPQPQPADSNQHPSELRPDVEGLCSLLADLIEGNGSKKPNVTKAWRDSARLMLDRDGRDATQAEWLIRWSQTDEFWRTNILSMPKFREKYDQLRIKAMGANPAPIAGGWMNR